MCGIVACRSRHGSREFLFDGLARLQYRGYDSSGIATHDGEGGPVRVVRAVGDLTALAERFAADGADAGHEHRIGIGHTRWATHGAVTERNAHPHRDCTGRVSLVHNGIIDNAVELRETLEAEGHRFASDVDSEVIAHLIEKHLKSDPHLREAVRRSLGELTGSWAVAVLLEGEDQLVVATRNSPLVLASTPDGVFVGSDMTPLLPVATSVQVLDDGHLVDVRDGAAWFDDLGVQVAAPAPVATGWAPLDAERGSYDDFMEKEIAEQFELASRLTSRLAASVLDGSLAGGFALPAFERVRFVACGTSLNAAAVVARVLRVLGGVPTTQVIASEVDEYVEESGTLTVAFSQSGETADVLAALSAGRGPVLALTNSPHSTLARRADAVLDIGAGPEIGVAATKTFTAQVVSGVAFALAALAASGRIDAFELGHQLAAYQRIPDALADAHLLAEPIANALAGSLAEAEGFLFVSRGAGLPYAAEGALKLKELTYRWAEALPAGELKHGPIALIELGTPVVVIDAGRPGRLAANVAEMGARGARIVRVGSGGDATFPVLSPVEQAWGPIESVLPLQHLARSLALQLGRDVDKPRNLAKSVTVE